MNRQARKSRRGPDQRRPGRLLKDITSGIEIAEILKGLGHPQERENGVQDCERLGAGASSATPQQRNSGSEFDDGGEIGERHAQGYVRSDVLP